MLATDRKSSPKIANSKYDPINSEMSEMSGRTAEDWHRGKSQQNRESPSWMHSCVLGQRLVLNIWLASALNTAMLTEILWELKDIFFEIDEIEARKSSWKIQSWRNKWTRFLKFSRELAELVGLKLEMAPNRMFPQLTDKTKKKHTLYFMKRRHACASPLNNGCQWHQTWEQSPESASHQVLINKFSETK